MAYPVLLRERRPMTARFLRNLLSVFADFIHWLTRKLVL